MALSDKRLNFLSIFKCNGVFPCKIKTRNFDITKNFCSYLSDFVENCISEIVRHSQNFLPNNVEQFSKKRYCN